MYKTLAVIITALFVFSCNDNKDEKPTPVKYFQLEVTSDFDPTNEDTWVILHNEAGALLGAKQLVRGETVSFDTTGINTDAKLGVTILNVRSVAPGEFYYELESYLGVDFKSSWSIGFPISETVNKPSLGKLNVSVTDAQLGSVHDASISNPNGIFNYPVADPDNSNKFLFPQLDLTEQTKDFFIFATDNNNTPYYNFLKNVAPGQQNFTLVDFKSFDKIIDVSIPPSKASEMVVQAREAGSNLYYVINKYGRGMSFGINGPEISSYKAGFLNAFNKFDIYIYAYYEGYSIYYRSLGSMPESINFPSQFPVNVTNDSFDNFQLNSTEYDSRMTYWNAFGINGTNTNWYVYSAPGFYTNLKQLPEVITKKYPAMSVNLQHNYTDISKGVSFTDFINQRFKNTPEPDNYIKVTMSLDDK
jgi:hypothetical protein